jgi:hypothetical protein
MVSGKPHIWRSHGGWQCSSMHYELRPGVVRIMGFGRTPAAAYSAWRA